MELLEIIIASHPYLSRFSYDEYPDCLLEFEQKTADFFQSVTENNVDEKIRNIISSFASRYDELPKRERKKAINDDRQILALFLTPGILRRNPPLTEFAEKLCAEWNSRFPKEKYLVGSFETIMKGFDSNMLGLPLRKSKKRK